MIARGENYQEVPLNIVGSSVFGRYPKISSEKTYNMFISDGFLVPYAGYKKAIDASKFGGGIEGRGVHTSTKLGKMVVVVDNRVYLVNIFFDQNLQRTYDSSETLIGTIGSSTGVIYITENNKPQIVISDGLAIYYYDPALSASLLTATKDGTSPISFTPGYIDYHDTYILCAASNDTFYSPAANNTWRLGKIDGGSGKLVFADDAASIGLLQTKSDNTKGVVRFPSRGNLIFVMGSIVTEPWFDVGYQLFPYQRNIPSNVDYGCLNPATIAATDEIVVWLAQNEKSGPIIVASRGQMPQKITTDGIDYLFSQLSNPSNSEAFVYRQDGHLIYHINFYEDNLSLFYDFNTDKFYHACDEHLNYFIAREVAFFNNQYYFVTKNNGNLYAFDTIYTTYDGAEIPRSRICKSIRLPTQEPFIANDCGFTLEQGVTNYKMQTANNEVVATTPRVDLSISLNGGQTFGSDFAYDLNPIGQNKNILRWWQLGWANDFTCQFKFWGIGRFVATDGVVNIRR